MLGVALEIGALGVKRPADASGAFRIGCEHGYGPSCTNLAWLYLLGRGVTHDETHALALFQRAFDAYRLGCAGGNGNSCVAAADALDPLDLPDDGRRAALLSRGCSLGSARACKLVASR
jgi:TPR repeat protein